MDKEDFKGYLKDRYYKQIDWYGTKGSLNKKAYQSLQTIVVVFAVITPTLVIIGEGGLRWLAVISSAIVAILCSLLKVFKFQENWINYRTTSETLRKEIHYYKAKLAGYKDAEDPEALFVERVEAVISRENTLWVYVQKTKEIEKMS